jgi:hypothetical protein
MLAEDQRVPDVEPEPSATFGDQSQDLRFVREAATQQNQPGLEIVLDIRKLEAPVEANLAVRELDTLLTIVNPEQLPQDPACYSFNQIRIVHEDAVVGLIVLDR